MSNPSVQVKKRCSKCGEEKPNTTEFFGKNGPTRRGLQSWCRPCTSAVALARYHAKMAARGPLPPRPDTVAERLWARVDKNGPVQAHAPDLGPCWVWTGYTNSMGYGEIGRQRPRRYVETTHRVAWELTNGPAGALCVLHKCDNPPCCNPDHLFLGSRTDNAADKVSKGRQCRGSGHPGALIDERTVRRIRELAAAGLGATAIARSLGLLRPSVSNVIHGYTWKHVV